MPAFAFPAEAGTHLPTPEGWTAELALGNQVTGVKMSGERPALRTNHEYMRTMLLP